jgi:class 3 adenylate cyclase
MRRAYASPETYTPKHLAEKILTSRNALEGERKQVTVLFADLKGSMELLADRDPEDARKILDPVLERMMEAVHRYEGTVNQVMGDGIMALFGAPLAHEDHAAAQAGTTPTPSTCRKSRSNVATKRAARLCATVTMAASAKLRRPWRWPRKVSMTSGNMSEDGTNSTSRA